MSNITVHLGSTTPFFFSGRPTRARTPLAPLSPPPTARWAPPISVTAARHCCRGPPVSLTPFPSVRPTARPRRTSRVPTGFGPLPARRRSPVGRDPAARRPNSSPPCVVCLTRPRPSATHASPPTGRPPRWFSLPEPLLRARLCPSVAAVPPLR
jgi:hypothetical protein